MVAKLHLVANSAAEIRIVCIVKDTSQEWQTYYLL
jgi:hypothetical protein